MNTELKEKFAAYPPQVRGKLRALGELIVDVAAHAKEVGELEQTLKWGEPTFVAHGTGTPIRIDWKAKSPGCYALYVHCQTTLIDSYRSLFPELNYQGSRAIVFDLDKPLPEAQLRICILMALRYHLDKRAN